MFCDYCGRDTPCASELRDRVVTIHGVRIPIQYKTHICGCCGEEVFDEAVETKIMQIAREQYRKKKSMLPGGAVAEVHEGEWAVCGADGSES